MESINSPDRIVESVANEISSYDSGKTGGKLENLVEPTLHCPVWTLSFALHHLMTSIFRPAGGDFESQITFRSRLRRRASFPQHQHQQRRLPPLLFSIHCRTPACFPPIPPPVADPARHGQLRQREGGHAADGWSRQKGQSVRILPRRDVRVKDALPICLPVALIFAWGRDFCMQGP